MIRATGLAAATGLSSGGVESGGFWEGKTRTALQALLHAAALDRRTPRELFHWTNAPSAGDAVAILASHPEAAHGCAAALESMVYADPRTRDSIWVGVSLAMSCLADPRVLDAVTPAPGTSPTRRSSSRTTARSTLRVGSTVGWPATLAPVPDRPRPPACARHRAGVLGPTAPGRSPAPPRPRRSATATLLKPAPRPRYPRVPANEPPRPAPAAPTARPDAAAPPRTSPSKTTPRPHRW